MAGSASVSSRSSGGSNDHVGLDPEDREALQKNDIQTTLPAQVFRLRYISIAGLVINTMIGTGIFNTPSIIMRGTQSTGITLLLWFVGAVYALAASYLYLELGLNTPRVVVEGVKMGVPRSGGELNYLRYIYDRSDRPTRLPACLFGVAFIIFANMSGNSIAFAQYIYAATGAVPSNGGIRGIAILAATFTCTIHSVSRRGGIWLSNGLAFIKICILVLMIVAGFCAFGGKFGQQDIDDLSPQDSFANVSRSAYGYANGFLEILFAYAGWNQVNMVLSEVKDPRVKFKRALPSAVAFVSVLYILVNVVYMLVVPIKVQMAQNTAQAFFQRTFGQLSGNSTVGQRVLNAFMAISSLGNIIVVTFTAARVKQELAKEGILPWPTFFGSGYDLSWRRLLKMLRGKHTQHSTLQETPVGSLVLHWFFTILAILATWPLDPDDAYSLLTGIYSYLLEALFPAVIGIGVMYLHLDPSKEWSRNTPGFNKYLSFAAAFFVAVAGLFPLAMDWIPPSSGPWTMQVPWFGVPTVSCTVLGLGVLYWVGFRYVAPQIGARSGKELCVERDPHYSNEDGYSVLDHEVVRIRWVHKNPAARFGEDYLGDEEVGAEGGRGPKMR